jgi:urease accessory protein
LFFEWLAPGRVASGESFEFGCITWSTDVWQGGTLSVRERFRLTPDDTSLTPLRLPFESSHYLGCFVSGDFEFPVEAIESVQSPSCHLGWSSLAGGGWCVKALCQDSLTTRKLMANLRSTLRDAMGRLPASLGRF